MPHYQNSPHPHRWRLHMLAILYFTMGFMVRFAWPPLIPAAATDLGMTSSSAGLYMSAFYLGYVFIHIPGGILGDRFGVRLVMGIALLVEAVGTFGVGASPSFALGFACRVLTGLGAGMVYSACIRYVSGLFPPRELGLAFGLMMMAPGGAGVILSNALMPWLEGLLGWRGAFQAISGLVLIIGVVALIFVRDAPSRSTSTGFFDGLKAVLRRKNLVFLALSGFWLMWLMVGFVTWGNSYVRKLNFSLEQASLVMLLFGVGGMAASPLGGILMQKVRSPKPLFGFLLAALIPCVWLFGQSSTLLWLAVFSGLVGFLVGLANPIVPALTSLFADKGTVGTASGVTGCIFQTGSIIGPWVAGLCIDLTGGFSATWAVLAVAPLAGIACLIPMRMPPK